MLHELLADVARLHGACYRRFAASAQGTDDLRLRVLFGFLAEREQEQWCAIARLRSGENMVLRCYVQSVPAGMFTEAIEAACVAGEPTTIAESYRQREMALEACFAQLKDTVGPRARRVFEALRNMKRQNQVRLQEAMLDF